MTLLEVLSPEARSELERDGVIELVSVSLTAIPDPERPDDTGAMKLDAYVGDNFRPGIPAIEKALGRVDAIATAGGDDLMPSLREELLSSLVDRRNDLAELREGKVRGLPAPHLSDPAIAAIIRPHLENPNLNELVWCTGWSVSVDVPEGYHDNRVPGTPYSLEKLLVYTDNPLIPEFIDEDSWTRIQDRLRRVDFIIGGIVAEVMGISLLSLSPPKGC